MKHFQTLLALAAAVSLALAGNKASAQITYGTLDNFDVINDTTGECHGFEIELEGLSSSDVVYTFGAPYQRYGDPSIVPTSSGVIVRYAASYDPGANAWSATTPYTAPPYLPTQGHSCWTGGVADPAQYYACGCDHFGVSLIATPTKTTYRWLVEGSPGSGTLKPYGTNASVPAPVWVVTPQPPPAPGLPPPPPVVQAAISPPPPDLYEFGDAMWVKVFVTELQDGVVADDLDHMVIDDPNVNIVPHEPAEVEIEWVLMQASINNEGEQLFGAEAGANSEAVSRRFEFYKYVGEYDAETHEARCDNPDVCPEAVGDLIGAQNVAIDLVAIIVPPNQAPVPTLDEVSTSEDTALTISPATLLANDTDPDNDPLTIDSVQDASVGTVALVGSDVVFTPLANFYGPASFTYTVNDGKGGTANGLVSVTVTSVNDPPEPKPDSASTAEDAALTISPATLLSNDGDVDGDALSVASVQNASIGSVLMTGGNVVFTPPANYNGPATFDYTANDGKGGAATGSVSVTVTPVNDAPVANAGPDATTARNHAITLDGSGSSDADADTLTYSWSVLSAPAHSRAKVSGTIARPTIKPDKEGTFVISLVVNDGTVNSSPDTVTITVTKK